MMSAYSIVILIIGFIIIITTLIGIDNEFKKSFPEVFNDKSNGSVFHNLYEFIKNIISKYNG